MEELHEARQYGLAALGLDHIDGVVIRIRVELHEDLADEADPGLAFNVAQFESVELAHAFGDELRVGEAFAESRGAARREPLRADLIPPLVQSHR